MVSYSPVKLVVEEQVPFTPPKLCQTLSQQSLENYSRSHLEEDEITGQSLLLDTSLTSSALDTRQKPKKRKQKRCGQCSNCKKDDCGQCKYCRDKIKFGGTGRKKQKCIYRKCQQMTVGSNIDKYGNSPESISLMEYNDRVSPDSSPIRPAKRKRISHQLSSSDEEPDSNDISCMIIDSPAINGRSSPTNGDNALPGLSPAWASIFRKPSSHDRQRSPKNSPKRPSSPYSSLSPRASPKKGSPLKRKLTLTSCKSPQKSSNLFNTSRKQVTTTHIDHAPFDGLVHVKQAVADMLYYTQSLLLRPNPIPIVTTGMRMNLGSITNALSKQNVMIKSSELPQENMNLSSDNVCQILHRYRTLKKELEKSPVCCHGNAIIDLTSKSVNSTKRSRGGASCYGNKRMSLSCKIHILQENNTIVVDKSYYKIDTRRRSLRLARKENTDVLEEPVRKRRRSDNVSIVSVEVHTSSIESTQDHTSKLGQDSWCDFYQPRNACDVIGNQSNVSQLLLWLKQWKDRCQANQRPLEVSPEQRPHPLDDSLNSSLFDEEEDEGLCAAMIISGPYGVGKTAAVYACAQELGYKVLEINSTHLRTRQHIMSTLREATLSHQVTRGNEESNSINLKTSDNTDKTKSNLFSFFASQKKPATTNISSGCGSTLTLATTTLILLEEVDVLFDEECRGFWSAVYDLILSTKRPLILTSNNPELHLECPYKKLVFAPPTQVNLALHCQLLSLSHDYHMTTHEANQLTQHFDIRKLFNTMQFWLAGRTSTDSTHLISLEHRELVNTAGISNLLPLLVSNQLSDIRVLTPNSKYEMLDRCSSVCDLAATMDILGSHDMSTESCDPWWSCHVTDSLTDELPNLSSSCCYDCKNQYTDCLTGLILKPTFVGMSLSLPQSKKHISQVQTSQRQCSDVFHYRTVLSHQSLVTDCLPFLHIICCQEFIREKMKTSRRFTHYLQQHNLNHLLEFVKYGKLTSQ